MLAVVVIGAVILFEDLPENKGGDNIDEDNDKDDGNVFADNSSSVKDIYHKKRCLLAKQATDQYSFF